MAAVGTVLLAWRGGEDEFCLAKVSEILALEEKCGAGIMQIMGRLESQRWYVNDVREVIRLSLIGGGRPPEEAMRLTKLHVDGHPQGWGASVMLAQAILAAAIVGVPDDPVGKNPAAEAGTQAEVSSTTTAASAAPASTASAPDSDGHPGTSTDARSGSLPPASTATTAPIQATSPSPTF